MLVFATKSADVRIWITPCPENIGSGQPPCPADCVRIFMDSP